jgi:hypothetical protein
VKPESSLLCSQQPDTILSHIKLVHAFQINTFKIHFHSVLQSMHKSSNQSLSLRFPHQNTVYHSPLPHTCHLPWPSLFSCFEHLYILTIAVSGKYAYLHTQIIFSEEYTSWNYSLYNFLQPPVNSSLLGPNIFLRTLMSNTWDTKFHTHMEQYTKLQFCVF